MRGFIVLCLSAVALAAPQGYNYNQNQISTGSGVTGLGASFQPVGLVQASSLGSSSNFFNSNNHQLQQQAQQVQIQPLSFGQSSSSSNYIQQQQQHQPRQETIISKRFFIHSAPEETDDEYREKHITVGTPRKNYNVVFIKAPSKTSKKSAIRITPALNEEKTVIYVLSKKTDAADIHAEIQEQASTTTKPEVFFIKYKTAEEAAHAQQHIQAQYDALGGSSQVSDEGIAPVSSVIGSLGSSSSSSSGSISSLNSLNANSHLEHSGSFAQVQQSNNVGNAYLPPNYV